jgi:voltage-gated potassium channel
MQPLDGDSVVTRPAPTVKDRYAARTPEDAVRLAAFDRAWHLPIVLSAILPLVLVTSPHAGLAAVINVVAWLVFVVDLVVHRRLIPRYLGTPRGKVDLVIVLLTAPWFLIPGLGSSVFLTLARLGRLVRLAAVGPARKLVERLGRVFVVAIIVVVVCSELAYRAEHPTNPGFATHGDALWWGIVTLTTVGYGDIVPKTTDGRVMGVIIMVTGVAVLGLLAGNLASFLRLDPAGRGQAAPAHAPATQYDDLARRLDVIQADLARIARAVDGLPTGRTELPDENRGEGDGPGGPSSTAE